jgi:hypothetical protein
MVLHFEEGHQLTSTCPVCGVQVTSGSVMAKILSSKAPLETLVISNGTLVMEVVCSLMVASAFKDVSTCLHLSSRHLHVHD